MERTISFVKGKGSINHNNREFITDNVDRDRNKDNIVYLQKKLVDEYGESMEKQLENMMRNKRKKTDNMALQKTI